jgi:hypothetical protein
MRSGFKFKILLVLIIAISLVQTERKVKMIVNFIRHGARAPSSITQEAKKYFPGITESKKLTNSGFRQMVLLGKALRKKYLQSNLEELIGFFNESKSHEQFLLISSPVPRAIESGVAYTLGLLPEHIYNIYDSGDIIHNELNINPPILFSDNDLNLSEEIFSKFYNFIIENRQRDILFHSTKCLDLINVKEKNNKKNSQTLNDEEKKILYNYLVKHFNETLSDYDFEQFDEKLAKKLTSNIRCINFNYKSNNIKIPDFINKIFLKLLGNYMVNIKHDDHNTKLSSSSFFEHLIHLFNHKVKKKETILDLHHLSKFNYTDLRLITFSGHDTNLGSLIKNLLHIDTINEYLKNIEKYEEILLIPFASNIDFHLIEDNSYNITQYFVRVFLNGKEIFEKMRSHEEGKYILYRKERGIPYHTFIKILKSRINKSYKNCKKTSFKYGL